MERRVFFRILSATSAVALGGCGSPHETLLPLLVPEREIAPGEEQWHPSVCTACGAGCGTLARVMEGVRVIEVNGAKVQERIATVKKLEGNPLDPVSGGRLCARGQAEVQALYHPDRLRGPLKRSGDRGQAQFTAVGWNEAIAQAAQKIAAVRGAAASEIVILSGPGVGMHSLALQRFAKALNAPEPTVCSIADHPLERKAAEMVFGWKGLPVYDLAQAHYVLGVGADFLGGWTSPIYYSRQYGHFRQGRQLRGQFTQAESRFSLTAAAADRWLPLKPGSEPQFFAALGRALIEAKLVRNLGSLPLAVADAFRNADFSASLKSCGLEEKRVKEVARDLGESERPLVIAGASSTHSNSIDALIASHYVNLLLGNIGKAGGVMPPPQQVLAPFENHGVMGALSKAKVVIVAGANPVYGLPPSSGIMEAMKRAELVISLNSFLDDTAAWADLILPNHHILESEAALVPAVSSGPSVAISVPFVKPLYDTRPIERTLSDLAAAMEVHIDAVSAEDVYRPLLSGELTREDVEQLGGLWPGPAAKAQPVLQATARNMELGVAAFDGDASQYPLYFQPYLSQQHHDGSGAHLPWMQELPDPASSSIWGLPIEIDPKIAGNLGISNGDVVRVESRHGAIDAPAYVHPAAVPGVISMAIGDGHRHYGRYASGRGANPLSILAPVWERTTGILALGATRVRLTRVSGRQAWIQFSAPDREERDTHR